MKTTRLLGLMSGTSLDGIDLVCVDFKENKGEISYHIIAAQTYPLNEEILERLKDVFQLSANQVFKLDKAMGRYFSECILRFLADKNIDSSSIAAIASHGQTIFHQVDQGYTVQIACGDTIAMKTGIPVINDFRTKDVVAGGNGAPLVPKGDFDLFAGEADAFLNIGGFSNVSFRKDGLVLAFDICPGNLPLNKLAEVLGEEFDRDGALARSGELNFFLLDLLNNLPYYQQEAPKSLGTEWLENEFYPLVKFDKEIENNLCTVVEHEAIQIAQVLNDNAIVSCMITGGGVFNKYLIDRIKHYFSGEVRIPSEEIVSFKEALIFAYLGYLYLQDKPNCLASVTGASHDVCGGVYHKPF